MSKPQSAGSGNSKSIKLAIAVVLLLAAGAVGVWQLTSTDGQNAAPIDAANVETPAPEAVTPKLAKPVAETAAEKSMQTEGSLGGVRRVAPKQ